MTVSELKAILDGCDNNATVVTHTLDGEQMLRDEQVYHLVSVNENVVMIDTDYSYVAGSVNPVESQVDIIHWAVESECENEPDRFDVESLWVTKRMAEDEMLRLNILDSRIIYRVSPWAVNTKAGR